MTTPKKITRVAGVSFTPNYPKNLHKLKEIQTNTGNEHLTVVLIRNPTNQYDTNAIEVHVPALGNNGMVGHVAAPVAAQLAPAIDAGTPIQSDIFAIQINPTHPDRPGLEIRIWTPKCTPP